MKNLDKILNEELSLDEGFGKLAGSMFGNAASVAKDVARNASNTADDMANKLDASKQSRDNKTVQNNSQDNINKFNYLKYTYYYIYYLEVADGESLQDKQKNKKVYETYTYLNKLQPFLEKIVDGKSHWKNLFENVDSPKDIPSLIKVFNQCVSKAGINGIKEYISKINRPKDNMSAWMDIIGDGDKLDKLASSGNEVAKDLKRFLQIFPESNPFVYGMLNSLYEGIMDDSDKEDEINDAVRLIRAYKTGEGDVGKVLRAWRNNPEYGDKFKTRIEKFIEKFPEGSDERKKLLGALGSGKKEEKKSSDIEAEDKTSIEKPKDTTGGSEKLNTKSFAEIANSADLKDKNTVNTMYAVLKKEYPHLFEGFITEGFNSSEKFDPEIVLAKIEPYVKDDGAAKKFVRLLSKKISNEPITNPKIRVKDKGPIVKAKAAKILKIYAAADEAKKKDFKEYIDLAFKKLGMNTNKYTGEKFIGWLGVITKSNLVKESIDGFDGRMINLAHRYLTSRK